MRQYKLEIELHFMTLSEADAVMEHAGQLLKGVEPERDNKLLKQFVDDVTAGVGEINQVAEVAKSKRIEIVQFLQEADTLVTRMRKMKEECEHIFGQLREEAGRLTGYIDGTRGEVNEKIKLADTVVSSAVQHLGTLDSAIAEAQKRAEACLFLKDISALNYGVVSGGRVTLLERRKGDGQFEKKKEWEV